MKCYRIKHLPTGLYYRPSSEVKNQFGCYVKTNLSKTGKIYPRRPTLKHIGGAIYDHTRNFLRRNDNGFGYIGYAGQAFPTHSGEWEIEEINETN